MDEGSVGLIALFLTGFGVSIVFSLVIKKLWITVTEVDPVVRTVIGSS